MEDFLKDIIAEVDEKIEENIKEEKARLAENPTNYMRERAEKLNLLDQFSKREEIDPEVMMQGMLQASNEMQLHVMGCMKESTMSREMIANGTAPDNAAEIVLPASFRMLIWATHLLSLMVSTMTHPHSEDRTIRYFYYLDQVEKLRKVIDQIYDGVSIEEIGDQMYLKVGSTGDE